MWWDPGRWGGQEGRRAELQETAPRGQPLKWLRLVGYRGFSPLCALNDAHLLGHLP